MLIDAVLFSLVLHPVFSAACLPDSSVQHVKTAKIHPQPHLHFDPEPCRQRNCGCVYLAVEDLGDEPRRILLRCAYVRPGEIFTVVHDRIEQCTVSG